MNYLLPAVSRYYGYDPDKVADRFVDGVLGKNAITLGIAELQVVLFWLITAVFLVVLFWPRKDRYVPPFAGKRIEGGSRTRQLPWQATGIKWDFSTPIGSGVHSEGRALIYGLQASAINNTGHSLEEVSGFVKSLVTGERFEMFLNVDGVPMKVEDTHGIPAGARFGIVVPFHQYIHPPPNDSVYMSLDVFEAEMRAFDFVFVYDGQTFSKRFGENETRVASERLRKILIGDDTPRVVKRKSNGEQSQIQSGWSYRELDGRIWCYSEIATLAIPERERLKQLRRDVWDAYWRETLRRDEYITPDGQRWTVENYSALPDDEQIRLALSDPDLPVWFSPRID